MDAIDMVRTEYVRQLMARNEREDSRGINDFRKLDIITGMFPNAEGSAQADLGDTRVLAGIKMQLEEPMDDTPNQGSLTCSAELLPLAHSRYESGPPSAESIEFARVVDRGIRAGNCIDLESLFVEEGKVWTVFIDLYVMNYGGNLFDAGTAAAMSALMSTNVPKYEDGAVIREEHKGKLKIDNIVTSTTFAKIGGSIVLDPSEAEETAADARMTITVDKENVRAMQKGLRGGFSIPEVEGLIGTSFNKHEELKDIMKKSSQK